MDEWTTEEHLDTHLSNLSRTNDKHSLVRHCLITD